MRAGEVLGLTVDDVELVRGLVSVRRGKGGKGRVAPFGSQTGRAIDRYVRSRRTHRLADTAPLRLGDRGKNLEYHGLRDTLRYCAEVAGIKGFHPTCCGTPRRLVGWPRAAPRGRPAGKHHWL